MTWRTRIPTAFAIVALGLTFVFRLSNPTLTETQLFLAFWPVWLMFLLVTVVMVLLPACGGRGR